ncbi:Spt20 family-domain-containing protein [Gorgonomyces haynaldii]|nr:Spt20 family-domain-containing protein [Gorgonomyces haynaldii]
MSKRTDKPKGLAVHLYPQHFTIGESEQSCTYNGPLKSFIDGINRLTIPAESLPYLNNQHFEDGHLIILLHDHRLFDTPEVHRLRLSFDEETRKIDINHFGTTSELQIQWTPESLLEFEARVLPFVTEPISLDPSPRVFEEMCKINYNKLKYTLGQKRKLEESEPIQSKEETQELMLLMNNSENSEFFSRFNQFSFVEEWRKKKRLADEEVLTGLGDKNKIKLNKTPTGFAPKKTLGFNANRKIVRTLRFESVINKVKFYHMLNVYDVGNQDFEAVLRWGDQEGTAHNGDTIHFPVGNGKLTVDQFIGSFKNVYGINSNFVIDNAAESSKS